VMPASLFLNPNWALVTPRQMIPSRFCADSFLI
jgi:hypothetical protein